MIKYFLRNQKATFTKAINTGTSTSGPITPANASPELMPKTPIETAMANSKLLPEAVKATEAVSLYEAPNAFAIKKHGG